MRLNKARCRSRLPRMWRRFLPKSSARSWRGASGRSFGRHRRSERVRLKCVAPNASNGWPRPVTNHSQATDAMPLFMPIRRGISRSTTKNPASSTRPPTTIPRCRSTRSALCQSQVSPAPTPHYSMWTTVPHLRESFQVLDAWGFEYKTNIVWVKDKIGLGYFVRNQHELLPPEATCRRPHQPIARHRLLAHRAVSTAESLTKLTRPSSGCIPRCRRSSCSHVKRGRDGRRGETRWGRPHEVSPPSWRPRRMRMYIRKNQDDRR